MPRLDVPVSEQQDRAIRFDAAAKGQSISEYVRRKVTVGAEPSPYPFTGPVSGPSFVRDLALVQGWKEGESAEVDRANERLRRFSRWSEDNPIVFAPQTTSSASQIIPPGYRTAITIPMTADRPLASATETLPISNAAVFTVPRHTSGGTVDPARAEGSQPTEVDTVFGTTTVSPKGLSGMLNLTRELVDSASPGGDAIALSIMREDWYRQAEILVYTELNGANGAGGTITAGFVPSGAQARVSTTPATNLLIDLRKAVLEYANVRRRKVRNIVVGSVALGHLGGLTSGFDSDTGDDTALATFFGARLNAAVNDYGVAAGDMRVTILGSDDVVTFESPLADFRFYEQAGPAIVRCAVWGYFGIVVARPRGLSSIRFT